MRFELPFDINTDEFLRFISTRAIGYVEVVGGKPYIIIEKLIDSEIQEDGSIRLLASYDPPEVFDIQPWIEEFLNSKK